MSKPVHIGDATLYLGDCRDVLPMASALTLADPPYGVGLQYLSHDDSNIEAYRDLMRGFMAHRLHWTCLAVTPGMKHHSWWHSEFEPRWTMSWHKPNQCSASALGGFNAWEPILVWGKPSKLVPHDAFTLSIESAQRDTCDHP